MASATLADFPVTTTWADAAATLTAAANVPVIVQNVGAYPVRIVWGGGSAPASTVSGFELGPNDSMSGQAAKIWVRTEADASGISVVAL